MGILGLVEEHEDARPISAKRDYLIGRNVVKHRAGGGAVKLSPVKSGADCPESGEVVPESGEASAPVGRTGSGVG